MLAARARSIAYAAMQRTTAQHADSAVSLVIGVLSFLLYLRDRKQGLYLWLALYLVASGLTGLQGLSAFRLGMSFQTYQLITQLLISSQDISMWLILLSLFGMAQERRWRRATGWIVAIYLTAQLTDIATIFLWEKGGVLPWIDGITTGVYSITPLYVFVIIGFRLDAAKPAFALAFDRSCVCQRPLFRHHQPGWAGRSIYPLDAGASSCESRFPPRRLLLQPGIYL